MKKIGTNPQNIIPKDLRKIAKEARSAGWTITVTRGGHLKWTPPGGGRSIYTGTSPGKKGCRLDLRAVRRALDGVA